MRTRLDTAIKTWVLAEFVRRGLASDLANAKQLLNAVVDGRRNLRSVLKCAVKRTPPEGSP